MYRDMARSIAQFARHSDDVHFLRFQVLEKAELEMLESHRNRMTFIQIMSVIPKISDSVDVQTQIQWYLAYEQRRKNHLGLNEIWEQDGFSASGPHSQDWIKELLQ